MDHKQIQNFFFTVSDFAIDKKRRLGRGAWAVVYMAERTTDHQPFAAKIYSEDVDQKLVMMAALAQLKLNHPAILKFHGISFCSCRDSSIFEPTILLEYMPKGTLRDILENERKSLSDAQWTLTKKYINLLGIAHAMKCMHKQGVIHRDIKPENILLDDNYYPKLSGFTLCCIFDHPLKISMEMEMESSVGTPIYMAPELLKGEKNEYGAGVDVYSFSIMAYEIVTGIRPFSNHKNRHQLFEDILRGVRPTFSDEVTKPMKELISRCWNEDPHERPEFEEIFEKLSTDFKSYFQFDVDEDEIHDYIDTLDQ